jgi:hypothetical protein
MRLQPTKAVRDHTYIFAYYYIIFIIIIPTESKR